MKKPEFLQMIFPEILRQNDNESLLDFIFDSNSSYQSKRTYFFKGNMYDSGSTENCRCANQSELTFLIKQFNNTSAFEDMTELISKNFDILLDHEVFDLININIDMDIYPQNFKYVFNMKNENKSSINILFYTYGNHNFEKNYFQTFSADSQFYNLFKNEFNYLWNMSKDITDSK